MHPLPETDLLPESSGLGASTASFEVLLIMGYYKRFLEKATIKGSMIFFPKVLGLGFRVYGV